MRNIFVLLMFGLFAGSSHAFYDWKAHSWEEVAIKDGIEVYRKSFEGSNVKGVAGKAKIEASPAEIIWVLMDHEHKNEWVARFSEARTLASPSPLKSIQYASFEMPFPISDRDFVYSYDFSYNEKEKAIEVDVKSVDHPLAPIEDSVGVRGTIISGKYRLYPVAGEHATIVEVEYLADPEGLIPSWIVNLVQKKWPLKTLKGLQNQVKKGKLGKHEIVKALKIPETQSQMG